VVNRALAQCDTRDVLNALRASIAVLDANGIIVAVNKAWIAFGRENGATGERPFLGADYLAVCERALASGRDDAVAEMTAKLRALLQGVGDEVSMEYPCDSPAERRWFHLRATPLPGEPGAGVVIAHEDITEAKRIEQTLRETDRTLRSVLEALPVGVWIMERSGRIVDVNSAGIAIWQGARYVGPERFGEYKARWLDTGRPIEADEWAGARAIRSGETSIGEEIEIDCFDGTQKIILNSAIPLRDEQHAIAGAIIVNQDITARKEAETELRLAKERVEAASRELEVALARERILAREDALTGITNRRQFFELGTHEVSVALRYGHPLAVILIDVDDFKRMNDTQGHQAGDEVLKRVARVARQHLREADLLARYGGDEFIVLLPNTRAAEAAIVAERLRADLAGQGTVLEHGTLTVTISSGIAGLLPPDDTLDALIHRADLALYEAKQSGRNRTAVFGPAERRDERHLAP
jgi:diguanylate cyclase (GGDEF)-like protein